MKAAGLLFFVSVFLAVSCGFGPDLSKDRVPRSPISTPFVPEKPVVVFMRDGLAAYSVRDYQTAIPPYKRALEIEQRSPKLDKKLWYALVANLAMSYGMTGDSKNARVVLAYGLSKDYNYPMFHYVLACTYAQDGDESTSLLHLRRAYEFRANMTEGETFPDPMTEGCFEALTESETFQKAVADMKKSKPRPRDKKAAGR